MASELSVDRALEVWELLSEGPKTWEQIDARVDWAGVTRETARGAIGNVIRVLRDMCADQNLDVNVTCDPVVSDPGGPWLYTLRFGDEITDTESTGWVMNRLTDSERRLKTIKHVLAAAVKVLDGRTIEGRKARIYQLHLQRAEEEVAMLTGGTANGLA